MPSSLEVLGVSEVEDLVYRWLVGAGLSSLSEIARGVGLSLAQVRSAIAVLERSGALVRAPGRPARFSASPPELALEALLVEREQALAQARLEVIRLQEQFRQGAERRHPAELAEILQGREAVRERVSQLWRSAREEILVFDKPPYSIPPAENVAEESQLASGVMFRAIYSKESMEWPGGLQLIESFIRAGEEARYHPAVPMKLNIFDRRVGLLPLAEDEGTVEGAIVVHSSHLLDALLVLWETFWERATLLPLGQLDPGTLPETLDLSGEDVRLATLLLAGSKSEVIARQMSIGLSTLERRIKRLMRLLGVDTRFQAGYELARRRFSQDET